MKQTDVSSKGKALALAGLTLLLLSMAWWVLILLRQPFAAITSIAFSAMALLSGSLMVVELYR